LVILAIIIYLYNRASFLHEKNIMRFRDSEYCMAYLRSRLLPEMAEKYRKRIRDGSGGELKEAITELKKGLK
jgi:hypothetical protein